MMDTSNPGRPRPHAYPPAVELDPVVRDVFDAAPMLIWISGPDKLWTWFNRPWLNFTGRTMEQELGNGWVQGIHADDLQRYLSVYDTHFDEQRPFRTQYRLRADDGVYRWIDSTGIPRYDPNGTFLGYIGSCVDIHDMRTAELHLLKEEVQASIQGTETPLQPREGLPAPALPTLVAHTLNRTLRTIQDNLEAAQRQLAQDAPDASFTHAIGAALHAVRQAPPLVERLLAFAHRRDQS